MSTQGQNDPWQPHSAPMSLWRRDFRSQARLTFSSENVKMFSRYLYAVCGTFLTGPYVPCVCVCACLNSWSPLRLSDIFFPFCCQISSYTHTSSQEMQPNPYISNFLTLTGNIDMCGPRHIWHHACIAMYMLSNTLCPAGLERERQCVLFRVLLHTHTHTINYLSA